MKIEKGLLKAKKVERFVESRLLSFLGKFLYFFGLTALVPVLPFLLFSSGRLDYLVNRTTILSLFFVALGLMLVFAAKESPKKTLRYLGFSTLLPAIFAFVFSFFGKKAVISILTRFELTSYLVVPWINKYVPSVVTIAIFYFFIGSAFFISSYFWKK